MRDGPSGRSRGFGFLTFKDPRTVNVVMVKEHFLDGKIVRALISTSPNAPGRQQQPFSRPFSHPPIRSQDPQHERELTNLKIDPKRAIPRDEQERTSKIFVGGVSQEANEQDFKDYFSQFGRVIDATLMIDKITHRPRGFGFVTFDSEAAVELTLQGDLMLKDKPIEVKKAQPRGNMREEEDMNDRRGGRRGGGGGGGGGGKDFNDRGNYDNGANQNQGQGGQQYPQGPAMTPQMMAQYWTKMQQYFAVAQQQMAAMQGSAMNPAMMAQMQQYKQMQAMQAMQAQMAQQQQQPQRGSASPMPPQSPGAQGGMNPMMMQQMQQMQAMAAQGGGYGMSMSPQGFNPGSGGGGGGGVGSPHHPPGSRGTPGYNAQDQLAFEQQKYEQQQARRAQQEAQQMQSYAQGGGGPTSWEGMYDDVPQPGGQGGYGGRGGGRGGGGGGGGGGGFQKTTPGPQSAPPANAPTGPKNAGKPGANYRGGAGGRGGHRGGYHPYAR
jgi:RNA-binding protein Musashi